MTTEILTERERQIAALVADGKPNTAIAADLGISRNTVNAHLVTMFRVLGVRDRGALAQLWTAEIAGEGEG